MVAYALVRAVWNIDSFHRGVTTWVCTSDTALDDAVLATLAAKPGVQFALHKSWCSESVALLEGQAQNVEFVVDEKKGHRWHPTGLAQVSAEGVNGTGGIGSSPQVTYRITLRSATPGRSYRGRMFLPGVPENEVSAAGEVDATTVGNAQLFVEGVGNDIEGATIAETGFWSTPSFLHATTAAVVDTIARTRVGTQRRRTKATLIV